MQVSSLPSYSIGSSVSQSSCRVTPPRFNYTGIAVQCCGTGGVFRIVIGLSANSDPVLFSKCILNFKKIQLLFCNEPVAVLSYGLVKFFIYKSDVLVALKIKYSSSLTCGGSGSPNLLNLCFVIRGLKHRRLNEVCRFQHEASSFILYVTLYSHFIKKF
jgi:hypothetical protein